MFPELSALIIGIALAYLSLRGQSRPLRSALARGRLARTVRVRIGAAAPAPRQRLLTLRGA